MPTQDQFHLIKAIALISIAIGIVGISLGSIAASFDLPMWIPLVLSVTVLAGAAEFTFIGMIATGANPIFAAFTGLLINLRHLPFGLSVAEFIQNNIFKYMACHVMNDESVMFGLSQSTQALKLKAYWLCGVSVAICWPIGVMLGFILGKNIPDIYSFGIDAAFPAILFALIIPMLKNRLTRNRTFLGAVFALVSFPFLPTGLPVLVSLLSLMLGKK